MSLRAGVEVVSNSEISVFQRCPREHYFVYGLRRTRKNFAREALTRGTGIHKATGQHERRETVDYAELRVEDRALVRGYVAYWTGPDGKDRMLDVTKTDVPFQITIGGVQVVGEFDGVGVRRDTGKHVIVERKSSSEDISPGSPYWQKVSLVDRQVSLYLIAAKQKGWDLTEVLYDVLKKPRQKKRKDESDEDFELRLLEDIAKSPGAYFVRGALVRLEHEHVAHAKDLEGTVHLMQAAREMGPNVPRNVDSCFKFGRPCEFVIVCGGGADVMDDMLFEPKKSSRTRENPPVEERRFVF